VAPQKQKSALLGSPIGQRHVLEVSYMRAACRGPGRLGPRLDPLRPEIAQHLLGHWGFFLLLGTALHPAPSSVAAFFLFFPSDDSGTA
jgi:hypothetical protein